MLSMQSVTQNNAQRSLYINKQTRQDQTRQTHIETTDYKTLDF